MDDLDLEKLTAAHPLPDGVEDVVVNRTQLGIALSVSENTISKYISQGLPVLTVGGNGKEYEFQLSDCYAWRCARDEDARTQKSAGDHAAAQLALTFRNHDDSETAPSSELTAKQIIEEAEADYKYQRAAEQRGELVRASRVRDLFEDTLVEFRTTITTVVDFAEMEFGLKPDQVDKLERRCNNALVQARVNLGKLTALGAEQATPIGRDKASQEELQV